MLRTSCTDKDVSAGRCLIGGAYRGSLWLLRGLCRSPRLRVGSAKADAGGHSSPSLPYSPVYCTAITALRGA